MTDDGSSSNSITSISGGVNLDAERDVNIGGDVVGRDKIVQNIQNIYQRALTATEEAKQARSIEVAYLAQGVSAFAQRLQARAGEPTDAGKGGPYKGLLEYRLSDADLFFGRDRAIRELLEHLQRGPLTVLHAESGAGKTSLLQAGISPRLIAAGHLPIYLRPYNVAPTLALKRAFLPNLSDTPNLAQAPLRDFLSRVSNVLGTVTTLYIFLDQFEEFFTQLDETARPEFVREMAECLEDESLNVRWVLALRSEFFGNLASFRPRIRNPFENDYRLNRLTHDEARDAVTKPAAQRGISFEDGLIDTILNDLGKDEVEPPQVQLVCSTLYETLPSDTKVITREMYDTQGGAAGILREHLGRVLKRDLPAEQRPIAQRLLEELITSDIHRVMRTHTELTNTLTAQGEKAETLDAVLSQLVDSRLLRVEETESEPSYELAHDYLLGEIKLDPAVQARKAAQELLDQEVHAYQRYATLLSDDKLAIIETRRSELVLNNDATALIQKSERALKRRQRFVFGGIGLVIVLFIVGVLSVLAAIGAQSIANQAEARVAIANESLKRAFEKSGVVPIGSSPSALAYDGARLWVCNYGDNTVQAIDPTTGDVGAPIKVGNGPITLAYDSARLWVANSKDGTVQAIDPTTGHVSTLTKVGTYPIALAYDGARLWVANYSDGTVQAIDPTTGDAIAGAPIKVGTYPIALAYDGARLWVANSGDGTVQALDPTTGDEGALVKVGTYLASLSRNYMVALVYDDTRLWVAIGGGDTVQAIDPATGDVGALVQVGKDPRALAYDGARLWVANKNDDTVQSVDPTMGDVSAPIRVATRPSALAYDGLRLWVADYYDETIQAIDPVMGKVGAPIRVSDGPIALAYDGARLWAANFGDSSVQAIDPATGKVGTPIQVGIFPCALVYDGAVLWVASYGETIQALNPETGDLGKSFKVGTKPIALAYDGVRLWGTNIVDNSVWALDPATGKVGAPIMIGNYPRALAYDGARLWVANRDDDTVQAIDPTTGDVDTTIKVGTNPIALSYDGKRLWVANEDDGTVQYILTYKRDNERVTK